MHCFATGTVSSVRGTDYDLRSSVRIGSVIDKLAETGSSGVNITYVLRGPTGSRFAARLAFIFSLYFGYFSFLFFVFFTRGRWT